MPRRCRFKDEHSQLDAGCGNIWILYSSYIFNPYYLYHRSTWKTAFQVNSYKPISHDVNLPCFGFNFRGQEISQRFLLTMMSPPSFLSNGEQCQQAPAPSHWPVGQPKPAILIARIGHCTCIASGISKLYKNWHIMPVMYLNTSIFQIGSEQLQLTSSHVSFQSYLQWLKHWLGDQRYSLPKGDAQQ